jgi:hypothetical protein
MIRGIDPGCDAKEKSGEEMDGSMLLCLATIVKATARVKNSLSKKSMMISRIVYLKKA